MEENYPMETKTKTTPKKEREASLVPLIRACEDCWSAIRKEHPELPEVVILIESNSASVGGKKRKTAKLGHFFNNSWRKADGTMYHEVVLTGEHLARPATAVFGTILHEAAHAINFAKGLQDTSRNGRYHNKVFKQKAMDMGMIVSKLKIKNSSFGWARTQVTPKVVQKYKTCIKNLQAAMETELSNLPESVRAWFANKYDDGIVDLTDLTEEELQALLDAEAEEEMLADIEKAKKKEQNGPWDVECQCNPPRVLKSVKKVTLLEGSIICGICMSEFARPNPDLAMIDSLTANDTQS